ncbi:GntP family permease [Pengzhenrongella frigida]|uniref:GntP family permease n=1 Tax=Pengzhenrongella frigida TaxID=1259133 RepID=A0A4V1ZHG1_9MICO|nr:SLC13 family permease [Cellulomonas sp. HLT2-17]RYV51924.1 GntP family permease [Cellulomonas sp. HLT2-17]
MEAIGVHWIGAVLGLALAIVLILRKVHPVYSLFLGAIVGALVGGASPAETITVLVSGTQSVMGTVLRVLAAGVLAGAMMETGAAETIAQAIVNKLGAGRAILALALAAMIITAVGVFIPVAVLIVAPIALDVGREAGISKPALLLAMSGGAKAGNIISPNPNTIAAAQGFDLDLSRVMLAGVVPALFGLAATVLIASAMKRRGSPVEPVDVILDVAAGGGGRGVGGSGAATATLAATETATATATATASNRPTLGRALVGPALAVVLLVLNPLGQISGVDLLQNLQLDALYILPLAGLVGLAAMGQFRHVVSYTTAGLNRMTSTALILLGAGGIAGLISASDLSDQVVSLIEAGGVSGTLLAPISGVLMGAAVASTSTGVILATSSFSAPILEMGTAPLAAAVMVHTGATVIDSLPHGNYFHVTADAMKMSIRQRLALVPYEALVGGTMTVVATIVYGFLL